MDRTIEIVVNGEKIVLGTRELLDITDINSDMDKVASQLGYWGVLWASAESEKEIADAFYRQWRAEEGKKITDKDPKASEWKVKQKIEASPGFLKFKASLGEAIKNATLCKIICDSLKIKANMLQSKGANLRHEIDAGSMSTKEVQKRGRPKSVDKEDSKRDAMRKLFSGNKKR